ncbi:MAG TPA: hypothetical protein VFE32_11575 [Puia sp.]|jgi:hypothetical protein|nr:hypothetical protein [Puia sp.]
MYFKFEYKKFNFYPPSLPSINIYNESKRILLADSHARMLSPPFYRKFWDSMKGYIIGIAVCFGIGFGCLIISEDGIVGGIAAIFIVSAGFGFIFTFIPSFINFVAFSFQRKQYYRMLKRLILKSTSYEEFILDMRLWINKEYEAFKEA